MTDVRLVDVSLRDGNQSLWSLTGVRTRTIERVAPALGQAGYHAIEAATSTLMATAVRYHREDPWARLDALRRAAPRTTLGFLTTGKRFISFSRTPANLFQLAFDLLRRHGVTRLWVIDPMHDMAGAMETARMARRAGFEDVVAGLCYTVSPVHTDEYFAARIAELDGCEAIDSLYVKDPAGLLTPERLRTLVPQLRSRLERLAVDELHTHCNTGLAPLTLLAGADLGMEVLHCALPPLADGSSHANALQLVHNLRARGHRVADVDTDAMARASALLRREARLRGLPEGRPQPYDEAYYRHTLPGGVLSTTRRQLAEIGRADAMPAVVEEAVRVRQDLGWPIVVTPFAQYIVAQATLNVIAGERYKQISDEVVDMLLGDWGPMPGPVDGALLDRVHQLPRARSRGPAQEPPSIDTLRARFGGRLSDEDLLLRALMPAEQVDALAAARERPPRTPLQQLVDTLSDRQRPLSVHVSADGASFTVRGRREAGAA